MNVVTGCNIIRGDLNHCLKPDGMFENRFKSWEGSEIPLACSRHVRIQHRISIFSKVI